MFPVVINAVRALTTDKKGAALVEYGRYAAPADGAAHRTVRSTAFTADAAGAPRATGEIAELRYLAAGDAVPVSALTRLILDALQADHVID